jgi:hypothetical protein
MGINATYVATTTLTGTGFGESGPELQDTAQTTPQNTNAPPPDAFTLVGGNSDNILLMPGTSFTFTRVHLMPLTSPSANVKQVAISGGGPYMASWTAGSITLPVAPGGQLIVNSACAETIRAVYS